MGGQGTSLKNYAITRLALVIPMVLVLLTLVFLLMRVAPGNPISAALGGKVPAAVVNQITHQLGFDKPLYAAVRQLPLGHPPRRLRHDDHRPPRRCATSSPRTAPPPSS